MSFIKCLIMYENRQLYPNANFISTIHAPILDGFFSVVQKTEAWTPTNVCISNYGFGGTNAFATESIPPVVATPARNSFANHAGATGLPDDLWSAQQIALSNDSMYSHRNGRQHRISPFSMAGRAPSGTRWAARSMETATSLRPPSIDWPSI